jgi:hypothetical protein
VESRKSNIFKQDDETNREERKIMTKEEFEKEQKKIASEKAMRRKSEATKFVSNQTSAQNIYESAKRKKVRKKPQLSINTEIKDDDMRDNVRRVNTVKNSSKANTLFGPGENFKRNEYFDHNQSNNQAQSKGKLLISQIHIFFN